VAFSPHEGQARQLGFFFLSGPAIIMISSVFDCLLPPPVGFPDLALKVFNDRFPPPFFPFLISSFFSFHETQGSAYFTPLDRVLFAFWCERPNFSIIISLFLPVCVSLKVGLKGPSFLIIWRRFPQTTKPLPQSSPPVATPRKPPLIDFLYRWWICSHSAFMLCLASKYFFPSKSRFRQVFLPCPPQTFLSPAHWFF